MLDATILGIVHCCFFHQFIEIKRLVCLVVSDRIIIYLKLIWELKEEGK